MKTTVAAVVIAHGSHPDLPACLEAIAPQVAELVVVSNVRGVKIPVPEGARFIENDRPYGFSANANRGIAETSAPFVAVVNHDAIASPDAIERLMAHAEPRSRCGIVAPRLLFPDGTWQPSRRRFPTVWGALVRRTPLRMVLKPERFTRAHYMLDERPTEPVESDWMIGAFLLLRRTMLDEIGAFDEGYRLYCEDIDLCYRAAKAGWERWYVPDSVVLHRYGAVIDRRFFSRHTLWTFRGIARFVRKHPERLRALV